ncbi:16S rRNA (guanine(527)-N(7))-methyltransferase RsmG [Hyphomicrobium methylovorum]|nr:16S rRNA (guanine(527)-N(7))-methyltransferase RsmG [Hyphomicrobium methylovorum]
MGPIDGPESFAANFPISRETRDRLVVYAELLGRWQKAINLVAPKTLGDLWQRHMADSAQLWRFRPPESHLWLDLGSGAGFPGLVLAILGAETGETRHTLVESDNRKAAFLREAARVTGIAVDILCMRSENSETRAKVGAVDCVTARALAPLPRLVELAAPYYGPSTLGLFLKGREVAAEIDEAAQTWHFAYELQPSLTDESGRVLLLKALKSKTEE